MLSRCHARELPLLGRIAQQRFNRRLRGLRARRVHAENGIERIDRRARELQAVGKLSRLYEDEPFDRRLACICRETMELYPEMDIMHHRGKAAFDFLRNAHLLDLVERFVGPEITCSPIQHLRAKLPSGPRCTN